MAITAPILAAIASSLEDMRKAVQDLFADAPYAGRDLGILCIESDALAPLFPKRPLVTRRTSTS